MYILTFGYFVGLKKFKNMTKLFNEEKFNHITENISILIMKRRIKRKENF